MNTIKIFYEVVFQSKSPDGVWKDIKSFPSDASFDLPFHIQDEISQMKTEFVQDLPFYKTRTVNRRHYTKSGKS